MTPPDRAHREKWPARTYLMCPPDFFAVEYAINPWMDPGQPVDPHVARSQWERLRSTYLRLGHTVRIIDPQPGLPDMVFAANGATVIGGRVLGARFRHQERHPESAAYLDWFRRGDFASVTEPEHVNEGEGDIAFARTAIITGYGFRTDYAARDQIEKVFGLPVISVRLVDPRFYHLDTALAVLGESSAAYYPAAFDDDGRAALAAHFSVLIEAKDEDAEALGLNAISDGRNVVLPVQAGGLAGQIGAAGFNVVTVDLSEFMKAGGGPKCCTLELRQAGGNGAG